MTKVLSKDLTAYDFLKSIAVILMVVDHIGFHFFPDEVWWRVFGRLCVPIWFFLIGYAKTREIPKTVWLGAGTIVFSSLLAGQYLFPLNILFVLMAARFMIDGIALRALRTNETLAGMFFLLALLSFPSMFIVEYGTMGLLFSLFGYMVRNPQAVPFKKFPVFAYVSATALAYAVSQGSMMPSLSVDQFTVLILGTGFVCMLLSKFQPLTFPRLTRVLTPVGVGVFKILGRHSLAVYVVHILIFRAVSVVMFPERFRFLEWTFFPREMEMYLQSVF